MVVFNVGANVPMGILETDSRKFFKIWEMACFAGFLSGREAAESTVPAPFEPSEPVPAEVAEVEPWSELVLPGDGEVLAMGAVVDSHVAVTRGPWETLIWR